jgi:hypothetical protein
MARRVAAMDGGNKKPPEGGFLGFRGTTADQR